MTPAAKAISGLRRELAERLWREDREKRGKR